MAKVLANSCLFIKQFWSNISLFLCHVSRHLGNVSLTLILFYFLAAICSAMFTSNSLAVSVFSFVLKCEINSGVFRDLFKEHGHIRTCRTSGELPANTLARWDIVARADRANLLANSC